MSARLCTGLPVAVALAMTVAALLAACSSSTTPTLTTAAPNVGNRVGERAPDFTVTGMNGQRVTLDGLLKEGKPFVLYFFATW